MAHADLDLELDNILFKEKVSKIYAQWNKASQFIMRFKFLLTAGL